MHKSNFRTTFRTGNQPVERQKCASAQLSKPKPQRTIAALPLSSARKGNLKPKEMDTSKKASAVKDPPGKEQTAKKCNSRPVPEIRHTLASKLRLVKANPLLEVSGVITLPPSVKKPHLLSFLKDDLQPLRIALENEKSKPSNTVQPKQENGKNMTHSALKPKQENRKNMAHTALKPKLENEKNKPCNAVQSKEENVKNIPIGTVQQRFENGKFKAQNIMRQRLETYKNKTQNTLQTKSTVLPSRRPENTKKTSLATKDQMKNVVGRDVNVKKLPQRTVTFMDIPRKKICKIRKSRSASEILDHPSPIVEVNEDTTRQRKVFVKTPIPSKGHDHSFSMHREFLCRSSSNFAPMPKVLWENLDSWLQKHGKTIRNFHHLHCFGLKASDITNPSSYKMEQESELLNTTFNADEQNSLQEDAIKELSDDDKENVEDAKTVVENTLKDLLDLIQMGYPQDKCEDWLHLIQKHFYGVREEPTYWECRAAVEETSRDIKAAIGCYEQAIIKGALPEKISKSLDSLMEKFNVLHLDPDEIKNSTARTPHKHILDARNIFKSSIIQFALQERKHRRDAILNDVKGAANHYVATPVRRSTRRSMSCYKSTPKLRCVNSLNQLDEGIRESLVFQPNSALEP